MHTQLSEPRVPTRISKIGIVGAGAMGTGIAALAASAGVPVVLLDVPSEGDRNAVAKGALQRAAKAKPAAFMSVDAATVITTGNTADHLELLADCDWVVEAIIEQPAPKLALYAQLETICSPRTIISTNTSGIPIESLARERSDAFRRRFLGTHFFNPPRYLHLLEIIPTAQTAPAVVTAVRAFADRILGKGVVVAKDTPGFIANRLGLHGMVMAMRLMEEFELTIDEVDALTGPLIGRPRSATFRTADISGLDVVSHVASGLSRATGEDLALPAWVDALVAQKRLGEKTGAGFYQKVGKEIRTLDWRTGEYISARPPAFAELAAIQKLPLPGRLEALMTAGGTGAEYLRRLLMETARYTLEHTPEIASTITSVDRAMEWGYAWEMGPYRQFDAIGVDRLRQGIGANGSALPPLLGAVKESFYRELGSGLRQLTFDGGYAPVEGVPGSIELGDVRQRGGELASNDAAALLDLGDGVLLLEFRGKMNTLGEGVFEILRGLEDRVRQGGHVGLVIGNADPRTFTAGADLSAVVGRATRGEWVALERGVQEFQDGVTGLRRLPVPVVVAPFGLTLGGGAEFTLHASRVQAHAELYMGLVEVGVGLIPAGGGTKELLFRFTRDLAPYDEADPFEGVKRAFRLISMATTSTSAAEARALGFLREGDRISMNRDRLLADAKARVLDLAPDYTPPPPRSVRALGKEALGNLTYAVWAMREAGWVSEHDALIGSKLAYVLSGGDGPPRTVTEQDVLDLEREAFLSLLGTKATQERIKFMLETGKPLRN